MRALTLAIAALFLVVAASAQKSPFGLQGRTMLVISPDTKKELKITKEQDKRVQEAMKAMQQSLQSAGSISFDLFNPLAALDSKLPEILDDEQEKRLEELFIQANGGFALADAKVADALSLTDEQKSSVKAIKSESMSELMRGMQAARSTSSVKELEKKQGEYSEKMLALLQPEQKQKLETMKGKPFKFKN